MPLPVRLATFNLENLGGRPREAPALAERIRALQPVLVGLRADVLCLQEVNAEDSGHRGPRHFAALDALLAGTPYRTYDRIWTRDRHGRGALDIHNLIILSRFPVLESRQIRQDLVSPPLYRPVTAQPRPAAPEAVGWDRPALYAALDLGAGRRLHVLNLHLKAPLAAFLPGGKEDPLTWRTVRGWAEGFFLASVKRAGQALEVRLFVDRLFDADPDALIAVAGDLNASAHEVPTRILCGDPSDTGNANLVGRSLAPAEALSGEAPYSVIHGGRRVMLDHILVSRPLLRACRAVRIENAALQDEAPSGAPARPTVGSHHAAVAAEFFIPDGRP